jgi:hypothetical protein
MPNWPNVDYKVGGYSIAARTTQTFTFWWPAPHNRDLEPEEIEKAFFDVAIRVGGNDRSLDAPLLEVKREYTHVVDRRHDNFWTRTVLLLTLQNDNDFDVNFWAAHLLVQEGMF